MSKRSVILLWCSAVSFAPLLCSAAAADDQELLQGQSVLERERGRYDAQGIIVGGFAVLPSLQVTGESNDNIYAVSDQIDDFAVNSKADVQVQSNWGRHSVEAALGGELQRFNEVKTEDSDSYYARGVGTFDLHQSTYFTINGEVGRYIEPRTINGQSTDQSLRVSVNPIDYSRSQVGAGIFHTVNRFRYQARYLQNSFDYEDQLLQSGGALEQDFRDVDIQRLSGRVDYAISPDTRVYVEVESSDWAYAIDNSLFGGINLDSDGAVISVGSDFKMGNLAKGSLFVGIEGRNYADTQLENVEVFDFGASVEWYVSQLTTLSVSVANDFVPTVQVDSPTILRRTFEVKADHELLRSLIVSARASYETDEFQGVSRQDDRSLVGFDLEYLSNRYVRTYFSTQFMDADSTIPVLDFSQTRVAVGLKLQI